jgi:hypothetical protein
MTFTLRQKHLDVKLKIAGQPTWVSGEQRARRPGSRERAPGPSLLRPRGFYCPQFFRWLDNLREFRRSWEEYERVHYPKEQEEVLVELLHNHTLGPELKKVVYQASSLGMTWTYLKDHLQEQRVRVDDLLSSTLKTEQPTSD